MNFALVNGLRQEAIPKQRGNCPSCGSEMVSKCGRMMIWHWAHKTRRLCDPWWENETDWHRNWKNKFPADWQEIPHLASTGERHIADVRTLHGLVIEFQHSPLDKAELDAREAYYGQMVWVVDGTRGPLDADYFRMGLSRTPIQRDPLAYQFAWFSRGRFFHNWSQAKAKVYIDFGEDHLWRLVLFDRSQQAGVVGPLPKDAFIEDCMKGTAISVTYLPPEEPPTSPAEAV